MHIYLFICLLGGVGLKDHWPCTNPSFTTHGSKQNVEKIQIKGRK